AIAGPVGALTAVLKVFLWPIGLWFLATRRWRAAAAFAVTAVIVVIVSWGAIGFVGFTSYPRTLSILADVEAHDGYSLVALFHASGSAATALSAIALAGVALATILAARSVDGDRRAFAIAIVGSLIATPVVWMHYLALLYIPIALYHKRLSWLWFVPAILWLTPAGHSDGSGWRIALTLAVMGAVLIAVVRPSRARSTA